MIFVLLLVGAALIMSQTTEASVVKTVPGIVKNEAWNRYDALFRKYATLNGINWQWLKAFGLKESLLATDPLTRVGGVSSDGKSWGLMQITLPTAIALGSGPIAGTALNDPELSVKLAAKLVAQLVKAFPGDVQKVVISYNQGQTNTAKGKDYTGTYFALWTQWLKVVQENP